MKAAARDIKAYLNSVNSSALVGYSAVDGDPDFRNPLAEYMTCGNDSIAVDIYGEPSISSSARRTWMNADVKCRVGRSEQLRVVRE